LPRASLGEVGLAKAGDGKASARIVTALLEFSSASSLP
jgi:hypothetical protein